jgi:hypothetical protein
MALVGCSSIDVKATGEPYEVVHSLAANHTVGIQGSGELRIQNGSLNQLRVLAQGEVHDHLTIEQTDGTLTIGQKPGLGVKTSEKIQYLLITDGLAAINLNGAFSLTATRYHTEQLAISADGDTTLDIQIETQQLRLTASGAFEGYLAGTAERFSLAASGAAEVQALDLQAKFVTVDLSGASEVLVAASDTLQVNTSGASEVGYQGQPKITGAASGASQIFRID